jgi:AraC-like DNA-binding protein
MDDTSAWVSYRATFIPSDITHTFQAIGTMVAHLFCEPESRLGRSLLKRFGTGAIVGLTAAEIAPHAAALSAAYADGRDDEDLETAALDALYILSGQNAAQSVDPRIEKATAIIAERLAEPLTLESVADAVGLSPGRFRHLFVEETGIPFRGYVLWRRMNRALQLGFAGHSWTDAAHATNFADSAHLSRTMRRMFGIPPTSLRQDLPGRSLRETA